LIFRRIFIYGRKINIVGYNVVSGILRGLGNLKVPLYFVAVECIINNVYDIFLFRKMEEK